MDYQITNINPLVISNDGIVNVSFTSLFPNEDDWIGAYTPAVNIEDVFNTVPVKFGYCTWGTNSDYLTTGSGKLSFNLTNLRGNISFYYFTGGFYWPDIFNTTSLVATYNSSVTFHSLDEPLRNRVVPSGNPDIYNVLWSAGNSTNPQLQWGIVSGSYTSTYVATVSKISKSSLCAAPANALGWSDLGNIYTASLEGMQALENSFIYYRVGDEANGLWSNEFTFWVPPVRGSNPPSRGTRVVMLADAGVGSTGISSETCTSI